jgi:hypothetical protein
MQIKKEIDRLFNEKMDRREFLKLVGVILVSMIGLTQTLRLITEKPSTDTKSSSGGYGSSAYGG